MAGAWALYIVEYLSRKVLSWKERFSRRKSAVPVRMGFAHAWKHAAGGRLSAPAGLKGGRSCRP